MTSARGTTTSTDPQSSYQFNCILISGSVKARIDIHMTLFLMEARVQDENSVLLLLLGISMRQSAVSLDSFHPFLLGV